MNLRGSRHQILNETMTCWAARHVESSFVLVYIPKRRRVSLQTCLNLDILWYFLKFFSVIKYWIPIKVLGLRFADLVLCPAFALQGLCRVLELHRRTDGLELGIWKTLEILGELRCWYLTLTLWMHFGWLAQGNRIPYHGNGSDLTGLTAIFNSRVWKLWTTVSEKLRSVCQDDICNTQYIWMQTYCIIIWHTVWHVDTLTVPFLNQYSYVITL